MPDSKKFVATSVADAAAVYPNSTKILLINGKSPFFINGKYERLSLMVLGN